MQLHELPADEAAVRRYVEELWLPYHRELAATAGRHELADDVDVVEEEVAFRLDTLDDDGHRTWIAVDDGELDDDTREEEPVDLAEMDARFAGFVTTDVSEAPSVFDRPDQLRIGDVYVREPYRGEGLARTLVDRVADRAREAGCAEVTLDVDVDNDRALAFYEKLGFETTRRTMAVAVEDL
ncbi:GNAT family N-acetyltransferase [Halobacteriales archaeon QS_8_69_26]|nr:MAG: GNAT family N-acetyltransferase [Halobacteriales archaeon QS_8_69_26]